MRWEPGRPETAVYVCEACGSCWGDAARWRAVSRGEWRAEGEFRGVAGFRIWAAYSPWSTLSRIVSTFLEAKDNPETLRVWVNTVLGESWEVEGARVDDTVLYQRRELYPGQRLAPRSPGEPLRVEGADFPAGVAVLTCGVDIQDDRAELEVVGWGRGEESWSVDYRVVPGDPTGPRLWEDLDAALGVSYLGEDGRRLIISACCVDSGAHTQAVYAFVRPRFFRRVYAIKGVAGAGKPVWNHRPSRNNAGRVHLYLVGVDTAKDTIAARLRVDTPGPGYCHFPLMRDEEWFRQLTGEARVIQHRHGVPYAAWVRRRARVEALDCRVYAYAALCSRIGGGLRLDQEADRLESARGVAASEPRRSGRPALSGSLPMKPDDPYL